MAHSKGVTEVKLDTGYMGICYIALVSLSVCLCLKLSVIKIYKNKGRSLKEKQWKWLTKVWTRLKENKGR